MPTTDAPFSRKDRMVLRHSKTEITSLLRDMPEVAREYREGMNREDDLREMLNTIVGNVDLIARQFGIDL